MSEHIRRIDRRTLLKAAVKAAILAAGVGGTGGVLLRDNLQFADSPAEPIFHGVEKVEDNLLQEFAHFAKARVNTSHDAPFWDSFLQYASSAINAPLTLHTQTIPAVGGSRDNSFTVLAQWPDEMRPDQEYAFNTTFIYYRGQEHGKGRLRDYNHLSFGLSYDGSVILDRTHGYPSLIQEEGELRNRLDYASVLNGNTPGASYSKQLDGRGRIESVSYRATDGKTEFFSVLSNDLQMTVSSFTDLNAKPPHTTLLA